MIPDWQLPAGVDRGLHDYLNSGEMVSGYDAMMAASPLAAFDVDYCRRWFDRRGKVLDLGCGTGRLARALVPAGYEYVGVDLSEEMLKVAETIWANPGREGGGLGRPVTPPPPLRGRSPGERSEHGGWGVGKDETPLPMEPAVPSTSPSRGEVGWLGLHSPLFLHANLVELPASLGTADHAACLFSTLGMVVGEQNRAAVVKSVFGLLRPGGRFVLHVHNRHFRGLGLKGWFGGDITSRQAYGGAPLTIHHYSKVEAVKLVEGLGFRILDVTAVGVSGKLTKPWWMPRLRAYGWLIAAERPDTASGPA